jgi:predicted RNA-binding Zn-ribbon protein involved in translation (DUF1610 family)
MPDTFTVCPACGTEAESRPAEAQQRGPEDGDLAFCTSCGHWNLYDEQAEGHLRRPTEMEQYLIERDVRLRKLSAMWKERFAH